MAKKKSFMTKANAQVMRAAKSAASVAAAAAVEFGDAIHHEIALGGQKAGKVKKEESRAQIQESQKICVAKTATVTPGPRTKCSRAGLGTIPPESRQTHRDRSANYLKSQRFNDP